MRWFNSRWGRHKLALVVVPATLVLFAAFASSAFAGTFFVTGHDQDFHCVEGDSNECAYYKITTTFVQAGSSLPILILDATTRAAGGQVPPTPRRPR
jgi:hypothetical protein